MIKIKFIFLLSIFFVFCCKSEYKSELDSDEFTSKIERIKTLNTEVKLCSEILDAEFELYNSNGFTDEWLSVSGPTDLDYRFVVKLKFEDVDCWISGMEKGKTKRPFMQDDKWQGQIVKQREKIWETQSEPEYFYRSGENVSVILFRNEGIIFKRILLF